MILSGPENDISRSVMNTIHKLSSGPIANEVEEAFATQTVFNGRVNVEYYVERLDRNDSLPFSIIEKASYCGHPPIFLLT